MPEKTKCTEVTIKPGNSVMVSNSKQDSSVTYGQHYVQKMPEYIEREALFKRLKEETHDYDAVGKYKEGIIKGLNIAKSIVNDKARTPTADVVSREVFEQVKWERDTALQTLEEHGIGLGKKADVVEVVRCKDCAIPHNKFLGCPYLNGLVPPENHFCSYGKRKEGAEE